MLAKKKDAHSRTSMIAGLSLFLQVSLHRRKRAEWEWERGRKAGEKLS